MRAAAEQDENAKMTHESRCVRERRNVAALTFATCEVNFEECIRRMASWNLQNGREGERQVEMMGRTGQKQRGYGIGREVDAMGRSD
ncbi:hypothetical protein R1flu_026579 [Riccia fluitans]|uniref:Uncharacterized protein n=1 Tax=Riccia fluitans TaxID=41844 RepID=A0ABD1XJA9_9MARC